MAEAATTAPPFSVGTVMGRGFGVLFRNFLPFAVITVVGMLPLTLLGLFGAGLFETADDPEARLETLSSGLGFFFYYLVTGALVYGAFQDLRGRRAPFGAVVSRGTAVLLPVIGAAMLVALVTLIGFLALIIPGIIAVAVLYVAVPVAVIERPGAVASLRRSAELTKGARWKILGLALTIFVLQVIVFFALAFALVPVEGFMSPLVVALVLDVLGNLVFIPVSAAMVTACYAELRGGKEGPDTEMLAAVFD